jgi:hypothetical protein
MPTVGWWGVNVRPAGQGIVAVGDNSVSAATAEKELGITKQQVSKWRIRLADNLKRIRKYRVNTFC